MEQLQLCFSSLHDGFHFNSYRDPFIIRFPRRDDWLIAPTTAAMTNGNFVEFIKFLLRRQFSYNVGKYYCTYICIYISTYARTYLGVVGSLLRNKDNNCDAVKKVNGREHGKKKVKRTRIHSEKKVWPKRQATNLLTGKTRARFVGQKRKEKVEKKWKKKLKKIGKLNQQKYLFNSSKNSNNNNSSMSKGKPRGSQKLKTS